MNQYVPPKTKRSNLIKVAMTIKLRVPFFILTLLKNRTIISHVITDTIVIYPRFFSSVYC